MGVTHNMGNLAAWLKNLSGGATPIDPLGPNAPRVEEKAKAASRKAMRSRKASEKRVTKRAADKTRVKSGSGKVQITTEVQVDIGKVEKKQVGWDNMALLKQHIMEWVSKVKRKEQRRDFYHGHRTKKQREMFGKPHSPEQIADRIIGTMRNDPDSWFKSNNNSGLLEHLKTVAPDELMAATGKGGVESQERAEELIGEAVQAWKEDVVYDACVGIMEQLASTIGGKVTRG